MTQPYYECHITFSGETRDGEDACKWAGWTYSRIDGDPVMGDGVRQYATKHFNQRVNQDDIWAEMQTVKKDMEIGYGLKVTRCKIELVTRDERY